MHDSHLRRSPALYVYMYVDVCTICVCVYYMSKMMSKVENHFLKMHFIYLRPRVPGKRRNQKKDNER